MYECKLLYASVRYRTSALKINKNKLQINIGSASARERRKYDPRINAVTSGYAFSDEDEDEKKDGENENDNNENEEKKTKKKKKKRRTTNVGPREMKDWARKTEFGSNALRKWVYSDNYGTHKNDEAEEILDEKNVEPRFLIENASQHMQPVDQGPGKFFQDRVQR